MTATGRQANELIVLEDAKKSYGDQVIFDNFSLTIQPGDRIVLLGANGSGKTTLMHALSERLELDQGKRRVAYGISMHVFDQHRATLPPETILRDALCPAGDMVDLPDGSRQHVRAFAESLGFGQERLPQRIGECSGGELARIHLGCLMCTACDVLFLDEPTNDLDLSMRETLEAALAAFSGAVVLVSHDRWFCEQVGDIFLGLDGQGSIARMTSVAAWEAAQVAQAAPASTSASTNISSEPAKKSINPKQARQRRAQVQAAERLVNQLEQQLTDLQQQWSDPAISGDANRATALAEEIRQVEDALATAMEVWEAAVEAYEDV
jgi:ATP-binding cassette subfamily F protein 3